MTANRIVERLDLIKRFLRTKGWQRIEHPNSNLLLYKGQFDDMNKPLQIALPATSEFSDTKQLINKALNLLSVIESRTIQEISEEIMNLGCDFLRQRIISSTDSASIPLKEIGSVVANLTNLIKYSAYMEDDNQPFFQRKRGIGQVMTEKCRFGQTFIGSFGISIEMPISPPSSENSNQVPFERRLMERIARGLMTTYKAVKEGDPKILVDNFKEGFNANLCETMQKLIDILPDSHTEFSFSWSAEYQQPEDLKNISSVKFSALDTSQLLESAAKTLRTCSESEETLIRGRILQLHADSLLNDEDGEENENQDDDSRLIVVNWEYGKGKHALIRIPLTIDQYRQACDAHRDEKTISISGTPEKRGRFFYLTSSGDFKVLS